ncbi:MAG TPA: thioesterase family protein [Acidimicrobiia bacterium]
MPHERPSHQYPHAVDLELIPLTFDAAPDAAHFALTPQLARHDGVLYGGTGAAAAVMLMEAATQRDALWVATQFIAQPRVGARVELMATTLAAGKRIAQMQVIARADGRVVFTALGATALPRPQGLTGQYDEMPSVSLPDDSAPLHAGPPMAQLRERGFGRNLEFREARLERASASNAMALWARLTPVGRPMTPAGVAFVADMVPGAIARAAGKLGGGFSLDNALRFAAIPPTQWVLLVLRGDVASHGYGHGSFTAWSSDGVLLATGSQTASMAHVFDVGDDAEIEAWRRSIESAAATAAAEGGTGD